MGWSNVHNTYRKRVYCHVHLVCEGSTQHDSQHIERNIYDTVFCQKPLPRIYWSVPKLLYRATIYIMSLFIVKFSFNFTYSFGWKHASLACRALWTLDWCERHFADFDTLYRVETWILRFRYEFIVFSKWYLREKHSVILMRCYLNQLSYNPKVDQLLIYIVVTANLGQEGSQLRSVKESCLIYMSVLFNKRLKLRLFI